MRLIPESRSAGKLWSIRLACIAAGLSAMEAALPLWSDVVPAGVFAGVSSAVAVAAAVARVIKQSLPNE